MRKVFRTKSLLGAATIGAAALAAAAWCQPAQAAFTALNCNNLNTDVQSGSDTPSDIQINSASEVQLWNGTTSGYDVRTEWENSITSGTAGTSTIFTQLTLTNTVVGTTGNWNVGLGANGNKYCSSHGYDLFTLNVNGSGPSVPVSFYSGDSTNGPGVSTGLSLTVGTTYSFWFVLNGSGSATPETVSVYDSIGSNAPSLLGNYAYPANGEHLGAEPYNPLDYVIYADDSTYTADNTPWGGVGNTAPDSYNGSNSFLIDNTYVDNTGANLSVPAAVPEPASLGLLGMAGAMLMIRRRRA